MEQNHALFWNAMFCNHLDVEHNLGSGENYRWEHEK